MIDTVKLKLLIEEVIWLVEGGEEGSWHGMSQAEIVMDLKIIINTIDNKQIDVNAISVMFAPTGHLQDYAIDNKFGGKYCDIANIIDSILRNK